MIQLIRALIALNTGADLFIFVNKARFPLLALDDAELSRRQDIHIIHLPNRSRPLRLLWELVGLPTQARRLGLDLLHGLHYTMPLLAPCPTVVTFHDMTFLLYPQLHLRVKRWVFPAVIRYSARHAAALLAVSDSTRQDAIRLLGLRTERVIATPLGVGSEFTPITDAECLARVRERYHLPERMILSVGLFEPRKNLPMLLRAFSQVAGRFPNHQLVLVGRPGWQFDEVYRIINCLNLRDRICFAGYVEQADLPAIYTLADLFVYPTLYEGFGLPVLEAMACGTPVITTRVSSLPELVGEAGELLPPGDEPALANALGRLLADEDGRRRLGELGRARAANFTWERTARQTWDVYQRVLHTSGA